MPLEARRYEVVFDEARIDPDVQKVLRRLVRHGHEAYLVGGCVRDLLLDRRPKDFDVATSARPEEVRELFRNSRIIGRRFRLVHVLFHGGKVIEVATFRKNPKEDTDDGAELLIRSDNVFGAAHEDAMRRDFTMNALFYDLNDRQILDWVGGMDDVRRTVVHTIGDPETRFREDPVRILRALKFAGRLGFAITPDVYDAIVFCREALAQAARPRLSEEILRLMRGGQARRTIYLAWETGVLDVLLPELAALLYDTSSADDAGQRLWRLLDYVDRRTASDAPLDDTVLWTLLLLEPMREACEGARDRGAAAFEFLDPIIERLAISRRYADGMRRIVALLPRLLSGKAGRFARTEVFDSAVEVALADLTARGESTAPVDKLRAASPRQPARDGRDRRDGRAPRDSRSGRPMDGRRTVDTVALASRGDVAETSRPRDARGVMRDGRDGRDEREARDARDERGERGERGERDARDASGGQRPASDATVGADEREREPWAEREREAWTERERAPRTEREGAREPDADVAREPDLARPLDADGEARAPEEGGREGREKRQRRVKRSARSRSAT